MIQLFGLLSRAIQYFPLGVMFQQIWQTKIRTRFYNLYTLMLDINIIIVVRVLVMCYAGSDEMNECVGCRANDISEQ